MTGPSNRGRIDAKSCWDGSLSWDEFRIAAGAFREQWNKFNSDLPQFSWVPYPNPTWIPQFSQSEGYLSVDNVLIFRSAKESSNEGDDKEGEEELSCCDADDFVDPAIYAQNHESSCHHYDFHIIYNVSYRVPVLYFRAYFSAGGYMVTNLYSIISSVFAEVQVAKVREPIDFSGGTFVSLVHRRRCTRTTDVDAELLCYGKLSHVDGQVLGLDDIVKSIPSSTQKLLMESKWTFITQEDHPYLNRPWHTLHPCGTSEWMKMLFNSDPAIVNGGNSVAKYLVSWFSVVGQVFGLKIPFEMLG